MSMPAVADRYGAPDAPGWQDVTWADHRRSVTVLGSRISYVDLGEPADDVPPVLLLHGFGGCWQNWLQTIPRVAAERRVIAVDLPGFGASSVPRDVLTPSYYARVVDALCDRLELGPVVLVGHSLGGLVAAIVAGRLPARISRLVLVAAVGGSHVARIALDAGPKILALQADRLVRRTPLAPKEHPLTALVHRPRDLGSPLLRAALQPGAGKPGLPLAAFGITLQGARHANLNGLLRRIAAPTLLIWGRDDRLVPVRTTDTFAERIAGSRLVVLEETGHMPQLERPRQFNRLLLEFLGA